MGTGEEVSLRQGKAIANKWMEMGDTCTSDGASMYVQKVGICFMRRSLFGERERIDFSKMQSMIREWFLYFETIR